MLPLLLLGFSPLRVSAMAGAFSKSAATFEASAISWDLRAHKKQGIN
jgi:hypothetical protein